MRNYASFFFTVPPYAMAIDLALSAQLRRNVRQLKPVPEHNLV
jgi:hypothetical protein